MAESTVVKEYLTDEMIEAGAHLTQELDRRHLKIAAAFWLFDTRAAMSLSPVLLSHHST